MANISLVRLFFAVRRSRADVEVAHLSTNIFPLTELLNWGASTHSIASDVCCVLLFASPFYCVSGLAYSISQSVAYYYLQDRVLCVGPSLQRLSKVGCRVGYRAPHVRSFSFFLCYRRCSRRRLMRTPHHHTKHPGLRRSSSSKYQARGSGDAVLFVPGRPC